MESKTYTPCGGCGAETPKDRCIGCFHPFEPFFRKEFIEWLNLAYNYTEDWQIMHCRYASDGRKLDTDLFEEKDNGLVKIGGTGRLEFKEVEYMVSLPAPNESAGESDAVEFHEWAINNAWEIDHREEHTHTAAELYTIFKQQKEK